MEFGIHLPHVGPFTTPEAISGVARKADAVAEKMTHLPARPEALVGRAEHAIPAIGEKMTAFMRDVAGKV